MTAASLEMSDEPLFVPIILIPGIALTALLTCHAHKRLKRLL